MSKNVVGLARSKGRAGILQIRNALGSVRGLLSRTWAGRNGDLQGHDLLMVDAYQAPRSAPPQRSAAAKGAADMAAAPKRRSQKSIVSPVSGQGSPRKPAPVVKDGQFATQKYEAKLGSWLVLPPEHPLVQRWDLLVAGILMFQAVTLPVQLAFIREQDLAFWPWVMWLDCWTDFVFWLDMLLRFFVQVEALDKSHFISDQFIIAGHYFRGMFLVDFFAVFPLGRVIAELEGRQASNSAWDLPAFNGYLFLLLFFRLGRFHKLLRFWRVRRVWASLQSHTSMVGMALKFTYISNAIYSTFAVIFFIVHVMACIWSSLAVERVSSHNATWFEYYVQGKHRNREEFLSESPGLIYLSSVYWAVFTVTGIGYGDITPSTPVEYAITILCMLVGAITWAWVVANIVSIMATINSSQNDHLQTLDCITELLKENSVKGRLGRKLREYFTNLKDVKDFEYVGKVIESLSPALQIEVCYSVHKEFIESVWWLNAMPIRTQFMVDLTSSMKSVLHTPSEFVPNKCELSIIRKGLCIHGGQLLAKGQVFGQDMILNNEALRRPFATLALTFLHLSVLTRPSFESALHRHPDAQPHFRKSYVKLVVIRGLLYRAEIMRASNRNAAANGRHRNASKRLSVNDVRLTNKPIGDLDDVLGPGLSAAESECDPSNVGAGPSHTKGARMTLVSSLTRTSPTDVHTAPGTTGGVGAAASMASAHNAVSVAEVTNLLDRVLDCETRMKSRMGTLEATALKLAEQVALLKGA